MSKYPVGIQSFENLRAKDCIYVDKTEYVYRLATSGSNTFFLSRPRRFGKSLLLSTLYAYFSGRKDLFEGLKIYDLENEWLSYPVLHFDFSSAEVIEKSRLETFIYEKVKMYANDYGVDLMSEGVGPGALFGSLIEGVARKTGKKVVILIDEYDKGIHEVLYNDMQLQANQEVLRPFFSQIKSHDQHLRFCLITGIARFRQYTLFSGFNNPNDISMNPKYAAICGISELELLNYFKSGIEELSRSYRMSVNQTLDTLRQKYDGYRFTSANVSVYNPFSLLNCFENVLLEDYWISSGTSKVFVEYLSKSAFQILELEDLWVDKARMEGIYSIDDPIPLLFQSGYLTIRDTDLGLYKLGIPNGEVRSALVEDLIPTYMGIGREAIPSIEKKLLTKLNQGDVDGFMTVIQSLVAQIPYHEIDVQNLEKTYHLVIYELFLILGVDTRSEVAMSGGRIDMVVQTYDYVYVIEFKLGGNVNEALRQIDERGYALPWSADGRNVFKIGAVFSPETRTLAQWSYIKCDG